MSVDWILVRQGRTTDRCRLNGSLPRVRRKAGRVCATRDTPKGAECRAGCAARAKATGRQPKLTKPGRAQANLAAHSRKGCERAGLDNTREDVIKRRREGAKARRREGAKARRREGAKARRPRLHPRQGYPEGDYARRYAGTKTSWHSPPEAIP